MPSNKPVFFDAHTHLQFLPYDADRGAVIARAEEVGVKMVLVGTQLASSESGIALAKQYPGEMWAAVGFHPAHASDHAWHHDKNEQSEAVREEFDIEKLRLLAAQKNVVAIGECGLDYFRMPDDAKTVSSVKELQRSVFIDQVKLAGEVKKPLMIHCRTGKQDDAFKEVADILASQKVSAALPDPGIIHFFTGTPAEARVFLDLGFSFTFGGVITFARNYDEAIKIIPLDRILSETDAPYVAPASYRGQRNEPAYVVEAVKKLAELKNVSVDQMAEQIWMNAQRIFGI
jgi:TatD DNase family protein